MSGPRGARPAKACSIAPGSSRSTQAAVGSPTFLRSGVTSTRIPNGWTDRLARALGKKTAGTSTSAPSEASAARRAGENEDASASARRVRVGRIGASAVQHETIEESGELVASVEREDMRDILIGTDHNHAAPHPIDAPQVENVVSAFQVGAEHLLVVAETVTALTRQ